MLKFNWLICPAVGVAPNTFYFQKFSGKGFLLKLEEFEKMDDISFQFLNSAISKMTFGIKELSKKWECGAEVHTEMQFPNGASGIFVIHDAFEAYIKK